MRRVLSLILPLIFVIACTLGFAAPARAASYGVQDNGHVFSDDAVAKAQAIIRQIRSGDDRDVLVVTYAALTPEQQDLLKSQGKDHFYATWAEDIGKENGVSGVVILLVKDPGHLEIAVGSKTRQRSFTNDERDQLDKRVMLPLLKEKDYDNALLKGLTFIREHMQRSQPSSGGANTTVPPAASSGSSSSPGTTNSPTPGAPSPTGFPIMAFVCVGIVILGVVFVIMKLVNRNQSYGGGYNAPPPGGYPPGYSGGGYPQGGGYGGGGGGGGFGRGLLGGLLGGALGAWGYERFNQGSSSNPNYTPPQTGGPGGGNYGNSNDQTDTSFSGTGGDFGSSNDSGGGSSSDSGSSGSDFGSSDSSGGGGGDFGSSGGDFGGGGGDSGGGGGDF